MARIIPTVGRIMHYRPGAGDLIASEIGQPLAAIVVHVWHYDLVNLTVFDRHGVPYAHTSVPIVQEGSIYTASGVSAYAEWMPFQKGQAAKYEKLEAERGAPPAPGSDDNSPVPQPESVAS